VDVARALKAARRRALDAIELRDCSVRLGRHWALREVTFSIRRGERWLLLGANGAGKTVLLKLLRGDLWPTPTGQESRRYVFEDGTVDVQPIDAFDRVAYLGPEKQDRYERYESTLTVAQVVLTGFDDSDVPLAKSTAAQSRRIDALLGQVGLRRLAARRLLTLSYGQRRRALLARALVRPTDVLLLDEALNGLDASGRNAFLRALRRTLSPGAAWILTSHRRADAQVAGATHLATLAHGRLEGAAPIKPEGDRESSRSKMVRRRSPGQASPPHAARLLHLERAALYREGRAVIAPFDWTLFEGEHWLVRGANGSGKSTLVALAYGDLWPRHGGTLQRRWPAVEDWKRRVGLVSPELQARYAATGCTVRDIVASGLHDSIGLNDFVTPAEARRVSRELSRWGLGELADRRARELSYGQLRLVLVARAFVRRRRLYLLDEPFDGLDGVARVRLRERLDAAVREEGATLVIVSHHADDVPDYVRGELTLRRGRTPSVAVRPAARPRTRSPRRP
jgi:molybdate transport system ATP-binding protein